MIPLEDNAADIIGKAQRGLGISDSELGDKAGVSAQTIRKLRDGDFDESALLSVAPVLGLDGRALGEIAKANGVQRKSNRWTASRNSPPIITEWPLTLILCGTRRPAWRQPSILELIPGRWCALRSTTSWMCN